MSANNAVFESTRDNFFINPKDPDLSRLLEAATTIINGEVGNVETTHDVIQHAAQDLTNEYAWLDSTKGRGARRFDHLSVSQLHPSDNMLGIIAHLASTLANNNTIIGEVSPVESTYELDAIQWLIKNIAEYNQEKASGSLVSGGTSANLTALLIARELLQNNELPLSEQWDGKTPAKVFINQMAHYSVHKAARVLGPHGMIGLDLLPLVEGKYTADPSVLEERIKQTRSIGQKIMAIVAVAGETETGQVDDLSAMAEIADKYGIYLHIDGAYGAPYRMSRQKSLFDGMSESDSITCDPHKYMYVPYASGSVLFADAENHARLTLLNEEGGDYMYQSDAAKHEARSSFVNSNVYLGQKRLEGSVGGQSAAALHVVTKYMGREGLASLLDHTIDMAEIFADEIASSDTTLELSFDPHLNTVCVRPSEYNNNNDKRVELTSAALEDDFGIFLRTTSLPVVGQGDRKKEKVFRFVATHPYTSADDVQYIAKELIKQWEK